MNDANEATSNQMGGVPAATGSAPPEVQEGLVAPKSSKRASEQKWGRSVMEQGFLIVPSLLLRAQRRLRITPTQLAVLMHLADYWWDVGRKPFPAKQTLGDRMGLGPRQIQRCIADLEKAGLVRRVERTHPVKGKISNEYDLEGLVMKLQALEPEFREAEEKARADRQRVARPGFHPKKRPTED
jgi:Helix-turn-helix domain